jgi:hypothetical protein
MTARKEVAFQPTLDSVFTKNFHDSASRGEVAAVLVFLEVLSHPNLLSDIINSTELVRLCLIRTEETEVVGVGFDDLGQEVCEEVHAGSLLGSRLLDGLCKTLEIGDPEFGTHKTTIGDGIGSHAAVTTGSELTELVDELAVLEQLLRLVATHPLLKQSELIAVLENIGERDLVSSPVTFEEVAVDLTRTSPALGCSEDNHGPSGTLGHARVSGLLLNRLNFGNSSFHGGSHCLVHCVKVGTLDEVRFPAITNEESL